MSTSPWYPNRSIRRRNRLNPRAVIPKISAARSQLYSLFIARRTTSLICIARSTAEGGMSIGASKDAFYPAPTPARKADISLALESGQIIYPRWVSLFFLKGRSLEDPEGERHRGPSRRARVGLRSRRAGDPRPRRPGDRALPRHDTGSRRQARDQVGRGEAASAPPRIGRRAGASDLLLLEVRRVVEEHRKLDAAVAELREPHRVPVARVEV